MQIDAQMRSGKLESVLAAALEAAAERIRRRVPEIIRDARLATAVHMSRVAEPARGEHQQAGANRVTSSVAVPAESAVAAQLVRPGERP